MHQPDRPSSMVSLAVILTGVTGASVAAMAAGEPAIASIAATVDMPAKTMSLREALCFIDACWLRFGVTAHRHTCSASNKIFNESYNL